MCCPLACHQVDGSGDENCHLCGCTCSVALLILDVQFHLQCLETYITGDRRRGCIHGVHEDSLSYFSAAVIKCHDPGILQRKGFVWAYGPAGTESIVVGRQAWRHLEQETERSHLQPQTQSRESEPEIGQGQKLSKPPLVACFQQQACFSPNCAISWGLSVQICEPTWGISHLIYHRRPPNKRSVGRCWYHGCR